MEKQQFNKTTRQFCSLGQILASVSCIALSLCMLDQGYSELRPTMLHVDTELNESPSYFADSIEAQQSMDSLRNLKRGGGGSSSFSSSSRGRSYGNCYGDRCDNMGGTDGTTVAIIVGTIVGICCGGVGIYTLCLYCIKRRRKSIKKARKAARRNQVGNDGSVSSYSDSDAPREPIVIHPNDHTNPDFYVGEPADPNNITANNLVPSHNEYQQKGNALASNGSYSETQSSQKRRPFIAVPPGQASYSYGEQQPYPYPHPMATPVLQGQEMYPQQTQSTGAPHIMGTSLMPPQDQTANPLSARNNGQGSAVTRSRQGSARTRPQHILQPSEGTNLNMQARGNFEVHLSSNNGGRGYQA